jgi:bisphosphoglycerate-dependent phosphoglycerate mutase
MGKPKMKNIDNAHMNLIHRTLRIHFFGNLKKVLALREAVRPYDLKINMETKMGPALKKYETVRPELVILNGFPESEMLRSVYYRLQPFKDVLFLVLNDSPNALKFIHVNSLSFIKMIERNPKPEVLIHAIFDLVVHSER